MRESIAVPEKVLDASVRLAKAIGLEGPCEVEFRRNANGHPLLMEINARLAGTTGKCHSVRRRLPADDLAVGVWSASQSSWELSDWRTHPMAARRYAMALREPRSDTADQTLSRDCKASGSSHPNLPGPDITTTSTGATWGQLLGKFKTWHEASAKLAAASSPVKLDKKGLLNVELSMLSL